MNVRVFDPAMTDPAGHEPFLRAVRREHSSARVSA